MSTNAPWLGSEEDGFSSTVLLAMIYNTVLINRREGLEKSVWLWMVGWLIWDEILDMKLFDGDDEAVKLLVSCGKKPARTSKVEYEKNQSKST
jgi:hypothetical protein